MPTLQRVASLLATVRLRPEFKCPQPPRTPQITREVHTPVNVDAWAHALKQHPNRAWVGSLLLGLREGIRIGYNHQLSCCSVKANMQSAVAHPLLAEQASVNVAGPFPLDP